MKRTDQVHPPTFLKNYRQPDYWIDAIDLRISLGDEATQVTAELTIRRNLSAAAGAPLVLDGRELELEEVRLNGHPLESKRYAASESGLTVPDVPEKFTLGTTCTIHPETNTALEGLYGSKGMFLTQCEAQGFRRITYYADRPDVMALFTTTIEADKKRFPVLLSNGNCVAREDVPCGRHRVTWKDPFKKPSYLFAMVAADLGVKKDTFTTSSGREVALEFFTEERDLDKIDYAIQSLKKAMRWDEEVYGREYDLDIFMVVATRHFNMGAMENKGLNIFNTSCVLANQRTQTDTSFQTVERVIAHEYFHNWSGNRVTCRDWFQLSLKEGFTVYRDAQFGAAMNSTAVARIGDANFLRAYQFPEDAGPLAHPVRPDQYVEINNFYTTTIYQKGAEVVRMLHTLLGDEGFRKGTDLYFDRNDGKAVTTDDFVAALEEANGRDFTQFKRWYTQAGTPRLRVTGDYDAAAKEYTLTFKQSCPATPGQAEKLPMVIPVALGLLDASGNDLPLDTESPAFSSQASDADSTTTVLAISEAEQRVTFTGIDAAPVASLLRHFSAPVILEAPQTDDELAFLAARDNDPYNRWAAGQELCMNRLLALVRAAGGGLALTMDPLWLRTFESVVADEQRDPALRAEMLRLPDETVITEQLEDADPDAVHRAREFARQSMGAALRDALLTTYVELAADEAYAPTAAQIAKRSLRNACLSLLSTQDDDQVTTLIREQFASATNMTDRLSALRSLVHSGRDANDALSLFYDEFRDEGLVIDSWFAVQATNPTGDGLARVKELMQHPDFELLLPNRVRAVVTSFCAGNLGEFHRADGSGYEFLADQLIAIDAGNPHLAARMAGMFSRWKKVEPNRQALARAAMERVLAKPKLSPNVYEVLSKTLKG